MNTYRFKIPVEVSYCIDESNIRIESVKDIKKLERNYDIDLDFVIDEYEYKVEIEEGSMDEEEEYMGVPKSEILTGVVSELWDEILEQINVDIKLFNLDDSTIHKVYKLTSENFNNGKLEQYFKKGKDYTILSMVMCDFNKSESVFYVDVTTDIKLTGIQIDEITKFIDGQCSDGWGEGFEQQDISQEVNENDRYVYVKTWNSDTEVKFVK